MQSQTISLEIVNIIYSQSKVAFKYWSAIDHSFSHSCEDDERTMEMEAGVNVDHG